MRTTGGSYLCVCLALTAHHKLIGAITVEDQMGVRIDRSQGD